MNWTNTLQRDRRGAVVVMAVFMSIFLVGCLWYVIGIGEAAIYRERLDAGSDAVAYTGAVYHARGMNMIAMLNLIIAATLALVVIAKTLNYIIGVVYYITKFLCAEAKDDVPPTTDPACAIAKQAGNSLSKVRDVIQDVEANGDGLVASLSQSQRDIALTTPWVASTESRNSSEYYQPIVVTGIAVSPSMMPNMPRYGLPVMEESFEMTCARALLIAPELVDAIIPPAFAQYFEMATGMSIDTASTTYPADYCGPANSYNTFDLFDEEDVCADEEKKWKEDFKKKNGKDPDPGKGEKYDGEKCVDDEEVTDDEMDETMEDEDIPNEKPEDVDDGIPDPSSKTAKRLVPGAENGNDYFQVYAIADGNNSRLTGTDKGVEIAAGKQVAVQGGDEQLELKGFGQAEFYYDQTAAALGQDRCWTGWAASFGQGQGGQCGLEWRQYEWNTMWNMRWRARGRYFHPPEGGHQGEVGGIDNVFNGGILNDGQTAPIEEGNYIPDEIAIFNDAIDNAVLSNFIYFNLNRGAIINP